MRRILTRTKLRPNKAGFRSRLRVGLVVLVAFLVVPTCNDWVHAQEYRDGSTVELNDRVPREVREVTVVQRLGEKLPLELPLLDSEGQPATVGLFFDGKMPVLVTLNYSNCPVLCSVQLNQLSQSLDQMELRIGDDFRMLTVSIDPKESTQRVRETKSKYVDQLTSQSGAEQGWTFCTAEQAVITTLTEALGFHYTYDEQTKEYFHPAMVAFVSPEGVITRYSLEVAFPPDQLKLALVEAGNGTVGSPVDQFILWCFSYDPNRNSYVPQAWRLMRLGGAATVGLMIVALTPYWIGRRRNPKVAGPESVLDENRETGGPSE